MSKPVNYEEFCKHYDLDSKSQESKKEYDEYLDKLSLFTATASQPNKTNIE
jgi:hypothetical protein